MGCICEGDCRCGVRPVPPVMGHVVITADSEGRHYAHIVTEQKEPVDAVKKVGETPGVGEVVAVTPQRQTLNTPDGWVLMRVRRLGYDITGSPFKFAV